MEICILGAHNCESRDTRLVSLLIDRSLAIDAGSITSSLSIAEQQRLKAVLITHHHFDHIRDLATLGMNIYPEGAIELYALDSALSVVSSHLFSEEVYVDFSKRPTPERPTFRLWPLGPYKEVIIEVTMPHRLENVAASSGHLTPRLLKGELEEFKKIRGYLPPVVTVHMTPQFEGEIREEVERISGELGAEIALGYEGMKILV